MASIPPSLPSISPAMIKSLLDGPAAPAPSGTTSNLDNPSESNSSYNVPTLVLGQTLATIVIAIRVYTKTYIIRDVGWNDYFAVLSWALFVGYCALLARVAPYAGVHVWDATLATLFTNLQFASYIEILYCPLIVCLKTSILLQYRRIFLYRRDTNIFMFIVVWSTMAMIVIFYLIEMFVTIFACNPREALWNKLVSGSCIDVSAVLLSQVIFNLISDVIVLAIPQWTIWRLHMTRARKLGLSIVFGIGGLACVVSALRIKSTVDYILNNDYTWYGVPQALWAVAEVSLGIISSSLPTLPKFFQKLRKSKSSEASHTCDGSYDASKVRTWPSYTRMVTIDGGELGENH